MGNQLTFTGGGELDNGLNVSLSFILDQAMITMLQRSFDYSLNLISSDCFGAITVAGEGRKCSISFRYYSCWRYLGQWLQTGAGLNSIRRTCWIRCFYNSINYTLPTLSGWFICCCFVQSGGAAVESSTAFGVTYTGVEGLSVSYGEGEAASTDASKQADLTSMSFLTQ